jgi:hypothetical protein
MHMSKVRFTLNLVALSIFVLMVSSVAGAQTRTWVSGVGDDLNPCSRTAPCKTFAGAISKTSAGGEIDCLDPGGFGSVTITKSITIDGTRGAGFGSILAAGTNGVNVNDSATATPGTIIVTLRNLSINGATTGTNGIRFTSGKTVNVEGCQIFGFLSGTGFGIDVSLTSSDKTLHVVDTSIFNCITGIRMTTTSGFVVGNFDNLNVESMTTSGIALQAGGFVTIGRSNISRDIIGINITGGANSGANVTNSTIFSNTTTGIAVGGSTSRISGSAILQNGNGISLSGGTIRTGCNNFIDGNTTPVSGGALSNACVQ